MAQKLALCLTTIITLIFATASIAAPDSIAQTSVAQSGATLSSNPEPALVAAPPTVSARAYVLMDANSGKILTQKNMDQKQPPASLTKMMTLYVVSRALQNGTIKLDDQVPVSEKAWKMSGSKMFIKVGTTVSVQDLIQGIIVDSGNDACVALAEYIGGSEQGFADMMNAETKALGMQNTHFLNSTGLPEGENFQTNHYSTAHDLAILGYAIIRDFPEYYPWYKQKWFTYNKIKQPNRNRLLWRYANADGLKTGHTDEAGFCLVSSAQNDNMRLVAVVLGAPTDESRATDSIHLLDYGFRFFTTHIIYKANTPIANVRVWKGQDKTTPVVFSHDFDITIPRGQSLKTQATLSLPNHLKAPVKQGQKIGTIAVTHTDPFIESSDLVALADNPTGNLWRRTTDKISHLPFFLFHPTKTGTVTITPKQDTEATPSTTSPQPGSQTNS